jgi:hypothetical protein
MSETVVKVQLVTENILDTLGAISTANGDVCTITQVAFWTPFGIDPNYARTLIKDGGVAVFEGDIDPAEESPFGTFDYWQPYAIYCFSIEPEGSLYLVRRTLHIMRAAIIKALMGTVADPAYTRGGYAHDTQVVGWGFVEVNDVAAMQIDVRCRIREDLNSPLIER